MADFAGPWITELEERCVIDALRNCYGERMYHYCHAFEREFAEYHGRKYGLMTPNCTSAIHLLLAGLGVKEGDEVIVPDLTWIATAAPISYVHATPVFADVSPEHWCLTPETIERCITDRTKAIIAVDLYGNMPDWDSILDIGHNIAVIEDAAEALGSTYKGRRAGSFGIGSVFSFHRTKTLTTGEGGMLLVDSDELYHRCKLLRDHGRYPFGSYHIVEIGYKYIPSNIQGALGYAQFKRIDELVGKKHWILERYRNNLGDIAGLQFNAEPAHVYNGAWCTAVTVPDAFRVLGAIEGSRAFFEPLSLFPMYRPADNLVAHNTSEHGVCLPSALNITAEQIDGICEQLREYVIG